MGEQVTTDWLRLARGFVCYWLVMWLPLGWTKRLVANAGDWAYRREASNGR